MITSWVAKDATIVLELRCWPHIARKPRSEGFNVRFALDLWARRGKRGVDETCRGEDSVFAL